FAPSGAGPMANVPVAPPIAKLLVDPLGEVVVVEHADSFPGAPATYEVRRSRDGALLSTFAPVGAGATSSLVVADARRALLTVDGTGMDVIDLSDPQHPAPIGRVAAGFAYPSTSQAPLYLTPPAPSADGRTAFVPAFGDRDLLAIDVLS